MSPAAPVPTGGGSHRRQRRFLESISRWGCFDRVQITSDTMAFRTHFARARVESLPFGDGFFEAALCCGSLHLFADTEVALREIARVLKTGAILSVFTFGAGSGGSCGKRKLELS